MAMDSTQRDNAGDNGENNREINNTAIENNGNRENTTSTRRFKVGTAVLSVFDGTTFRGKITRRFDGMYYKIKYSDGDGEELNHEEVEQRLENKNANNFETGRESRGFVQTDMHGDCMPEKDSEAFGHNYPKKPFDNSSIITFQNIGRLPKSAFGHKSVQMSKAFKDSNANIALYAEPSINDRFLNPNEKFNDRMKMKNPGSFSMLSYNSNMGEEATWDTIGGTAITMDANFTSHMTKQGYGMDKTGLGRWCWIRLRGCCNIFTRFVTAYRPCKNTKSIRGAWGQQVNYYRNKSNIRNPDPRKIFDEEFCKELDVWHELGDNLVIGIDVNDDAQHSQLANKLKSSYDLKDAVLSTHCDQSPPATFNRNTNRKVIDAIYVSENLNVLQAGYMPFDSGSPAVKSDGHRMLWAMIDNLSMFGKHIPCSTLAIECERVKSNDPRSRKVYHREVKKEYERQNIFATKKRMEKEAKMYKRDKNSAKAQNLNQL